MAPTVEELVGRGEIGGRTVQISDRGLVECGTYPVAPLPAGTVRVRTLRSAISPGTEMTFLGRAATNVHLHKTWDPELRLFRAGEPSIAYPVVFGYRAVGQVTESGAEALPVGTPIYGNWRHTEFVALGLKQALAQRLPAGLSPRDGVDIAQMGPICLNAVAHADEEHVGRTTVVFGAGPIGLITAQLARLGGAREVCVVDRLPTRLAIAESLGLIPVDASAVDDVAASLKRRLGADSVAVALECTGSTQALHEAIRVVRRRGTIVALGFYQGDAAGLRLGEEFHHNGVRVCSGQIGNIHPGWTIDGLRTRVAELAGSGQLILGGLPRLTFPVERAAEGFEALRRPADVLQVELTYG